MIADRKSVDASYLGGAGNYPMLLHPAHAIRSGNVAAEVEAVSGRYGGDAVARRLAAAGRRAAGDIPSGRLATAQRSGDVNQQWQGDQPVQPGNGTEGEIH
jgi:hypothetical protein